MISDVTKWFVVFWPKNPNGRSIFYREWWEDWWAIGGWRHVSAFGFSPTTGCWVFVNPQPNGLQILSMPDSDDLDDIIGPMLAYCSVIEVDAKPAKRYPRLPLFNCVSIIRHLIGSGGGALSPWGLRTYLLRTCKEVSHELPGNNHSLSCRNSGHDGFDQRG